MAYGHKMTDLNDSGWKVSVIKQIQSETDVVDRNFVRAGIFAGRVGGGGGAADLLEEGMSVLSCQGTGIGCNHNSNGSFLSGYVNFV